jgi:hypothetical protein
MKDLLVLLTAHGQDDHEQPHQNTLSWQSQPSGNDHVHVVSVFSLVTGAIERLSEREDADHGLRRNNSDTPEGQWYLI